MDTSKFIPFDKVADLKLLTTDMVFQMCSKSLIPYINDRGLLLVNPDYVSMLLGDIIEQTPMNKVRTEEVGKKKVKKKATEPPAEEPAE